MKTILGHVVAAAALALAGGICWLLGEAERQVAAVHEQLVTMRYAVAADEVSEDPELGLVERLPLAGPRFSAGLRHGQAAAEYWLARYDALKTARDAGGALSEPDPELLLLAANAAFRAASGGVVDRATGITRLNEVIKSYGEVMKSRPEDADAPYNYEFAVRKRDEIARQRSAAGVKVGPPEVPSSIHGRPGAPPDGVGMSQFKIMVPKQSDERREDPEAGKGGAKQRKG